MAEDDKWMTDFQGTKTMAVGWDFIQKTYADDPSKFCLIGQWMPWPRPGVRLLITRLEFEHFPPDTPANELYEPGAFVKAVTAYRPATDATPS
jgi:hypothetical protein